MIKKRPSAVTLLELLIAIILISVVVLGMSSFEFFGRFHALDSGKRARLQNEVSFTLEHMTKNIAQAVGFADNNPILITNVSGDPIIYINIDSDRDGVFTVMGDSVVAYRFKMNPEREIWFYTGILNPANPGPSGPYEVVSKKIASCNFQHTWNSAQRDNYVTVTISACEDPVTASLPNGTIENPCVTMRTNIVMPSVSVN